VRVGVDREVAVLAFGIPGLREIALIALVVLALYGRNGARLLMATPYGRTLQPWLRLVGAGSRAAAGRPATAAASAPRRPFLLRRGRWFWAFTLVIAAMAAAWVATRMVVLSAHGSN
jgi:hypothetical protein